MKVETGTVVLQDKGHSASAITDGEVLVFNARLMAEADSSGFISSSRIEDSAWQGDKQQSASSAKVTHPSNLELRERKQSAFERV